MFYVFISFLRFFSFLIFLKFLSVLLKQNVLQTDNILIQIPSNKCMERKSLDFFHFIFVHKMLSILFKCEWKNVLIVLTRIVRKQYGRLFKHERHCHWNIYFIFDISKVIDWQTFFKFFVLSLSYCNICASVPTVGVDFDLRRKKATRTGKTTTNF